MKKIVNILVVLFLICGMAVVSFAQTQQAAVTKKVEAKAGFITGKIIAIDTAKNAIVVKEDKTGIEKTITVEAKAISSFKVNERVKVSFKEGSDIAASVKKIIKKTTPAKK
jgi:uncharacterized protein HemX